MSFFDAGNANPSMDVLLAAAHAYSHFLIVFHRDKIDGMISAWMVVPNEFAEGIAAWALGEGNVSNPSNHKFIVMRGRVNKSSLSKWLVKTDFMEFTQPECMLAEAPGDSRAVTTEWEQVGIDGVDVPYFPPDILETALFASGMGLDKDGDFVPVHRGFEDPCNVGADLVYARNATWEMMFFNANKSVGAVPMPMPM